MTQTPTALPDTIIGLKFDTEACDALLGAHRGRLAELLGMTAAQIRQRFNHRRGGRGPHIYSLCEELVALHNDTETDDPKIRIALQGLLTSGLFTIDEHGVLQTTTPQAHVPEGNAP